MGKQILKHRGYEGSVEVSVEDNVLHGHILFINDMITFEGTTPEELKAAFRESVDDYLQDCEEDGREPDKPFSGHFNIRIGRDRHKELARIAFQRDVSINNLVCHAIDGFLKHDGKPRTITNINTRNMQVPYAPKEEAKPRTSRLSWDYRSNTDNVVQLRQAR